MIPLAVPNLAGKEREYLNRCIDTTFVSSVGEFVNKIEEMMADICGAKYAVATSSGTTGLHLALIGSGVSRDELVIIPTFTFIATANAVAHCGAMPWLMDINPASWTLDVNQLKEELREKTIRRNGQVFHKENGKRVAAIVPVYTLGNVADMDGIRLIAKEYNLPIIADAAAALGATYYGQKLGELADVTVFSFNGNKTVTAGGGGMIVGNNEGMMRKLKHLSTTARVTAEYDHDMVGYNYRMTNIQAAVGCAQLEQLDAFVNRKREIRQYYNEVFSKAEGISFFPIPENVNSACWFSGVVLQKEGIEKVRQICQGMKEKGIECRSFWKPVHFQKPYANALKANSFMVTDSIWDKIITLPCSTNISDKELKCVTDSFLEMWQTEEN